MENQTTTENRKHKDSLFVDYFSKDRDWKQHFLSLYNALHGTNLQVETTKLERVNLEQVLYMDYYNDIAVMVNDQFILMIEHQSTINPNMPLRLLEYVTRIYGNKLDSKTKFSNQLIPLARRFNLYESISKRIAKDKRFREINEPLKDLDKPLRKGLRIHRSKIGNYIRACLRELAGISFENRGKGFEFDFGYDYYMHIRSSLPVERLNQIARQNDLFLDPR